jgi:hypothetical protein
MSDLNLLKLVTLSSRADVPLIPPLQQVVIFINNLGYICELEPQWVPNEPFEISFCSSDNSETQMEALGLRG